MGTAIEVVERLRDAMNKHDPAAIAGCFDPEYRSEQPVHPNRGFGGAAQVEKNWTGLLAGIPDFRADVLQSISEGDRVWAEWHWHGSRTDGTAFAERGVSIFGVRDDRILWARLYLEEVETRRAPVRWPPSRSRSEPCTRGAGYSE